MKRMFYRSIFLYGLLFSPLVFSQLSPYYQEQTAEQKQAELWQQIESSEWQTRPAFNDDGWSSILKNIKALMSLGKTFDHVSDEIPEGRPKFIHTYGSVAKVEFVPAPGHHYTGLYASGAIGLARLSLAAAPGKSNYTPGMAIKFLIDGLPSRNLVVMNSLEGQEDNWNYFEKDFSNQIDHPTSFVLKILEKVFEWTRNPANDLPLNHLAKIKRDGKEEPKDIFPPRIIFRPTDEVRHLIPKDSREDLRTSLESKVRPGTAIYQVFGVEGQDEILIGTLYTASEFIASSYGDKKLFFQHQR